MTAIKAFAILLLVGFIVLAGIAHATQDQPADLVFVSGELVTLAESPETAQALAVRDGEIVALGSDEDIGFLIGADTEVIELNGRMLMPGFIEGHGHFLGLGESLMTLDLRSTRSFEELVRRVEEAVAEAEPGEWITGRGWHQENWQESGPGVVDGVPGHDALSAVSPDNPVFLRHASGHAALANAWAMELAGIDAETPDPEGGEIVRDANGQPTGFLRQAAQFVVRDQMRDWFEGLGEDARQARFERQVALAAHEALRHGVTGFHDQGQRFDAIDRLIALDESGGLPLRLYVAVIGETNAELDRRLSGYRRLPSEGQMLTLRSVKRHLDGALGTHGAWLLRPYADRPDRSGLPQMSVDELTETARIAFEHGFQLNTHAIGDRANREALSIYAA
ncbi:MAG: amidohydrolase family protein, partial [Wenzhouxiangella sp.]|nr:amidohydrolase family protein [Wenzhouxiangella sp.]